MKFVIFINLKELLNLKELFNNSEELIQRYLRVILQDFIHSIHFRLPLKYLNSIPFIKSLQKISNEKMF